MIFFKSLIFVKFLEFNLFFTVLRRYGQVFIPLAVTDLDMLSYKQEKWSLGEPHVKRKHPGGRKCRIMFILFEQTDLSFSM